MSYHTLLSNMQALNKLFFLGACSVPYEGVLHMNPGLAASCCVDPFGVFISPVLLSNNNNNNNRPDIVVLEKEGRVQCFIVNVTSPFDTRVAEKETEN